MVQRAVQQLLMKNLLVAMLAQCLQYHFKVQLIVGVRRIYSNDISYLTNMHCTEKPC